jgi:arylsulfatase A-like enzyme
MFGPMNGHGASAKDFTTGTSLALVVSIGAVFGLLEVVVLGVLKYASLAQPQGRLAVGWDATWRNGFLWLSPHIIWMAPAALTAILALVASIGMLAGRLLAKDSFRAVTGMVFFVAYVNLFLVYPRLYDAAVVVLAAGLAIQTVRIAVRHQGTLLKNVRRGAPWLGGVVISCAVVLLVAQVLGESRTIARLPAPLSRAPNILLIILDTVRAQNLSVYGYERPTTPNLEALAKRGVVFERAMATSPWTLPSHISAFTGRWPYETTGSWLTPYEGEHLTLAEHLQSNGYLTAGFVANVVYCGYESGIDRGFAHYEDYRVNASELLLSAAITRRYANSRPVRRMVGYHDVINRKRAGDVTAEFLDWSGTDLDRPFFAFLNYLDAHEPYMPPEPFASRFGDPAVRRNDQNRHDLRLTVRLGREEMSQREQDAEIDAYDGSIAYIDEQLGILFDTLAARGLLDETVVVVTADHGEMFGEHGFFTHGNNLYVPTVHVPLIVAFGDRLPGGTRITTPVSIRDLPTTLTAIAELPLNPFAGGRLDSLWTGDADTETPPVLSEWTTIAGNLSTKSLLVGRYHYIWGENVQEAVFDLAADPGEHTDLSASARESGLLTQLRRAMAPHVRNDVELWNRLPQRTAPPPGTR